VLCIAFGNPLRGDDGVGWHVAAALRADQRTAGMTIHPCHQLTPELAEDIACSGLVVLVDARDDGSPPGSVSVIEIAADLVADERGRAADSHSFGPVALVTLAAELFGRAPPVALVTVAVAAVDVGEHLSPPVELAVPVAVDAVIGIVSHHQALTTPT